MSTLTEVNQTGSDKVVIDQPLSKEKEDYLKQVQDYLDNSDFNNKTELRLYKMSYDFLSSTERVKLIQEFGKKNK